MATLSKPTKFLLLGSALLLPVLILALARLPNGTNASGQALPSSHGWTCDWLGEPTIRKGILRSQCRGVVHCRHLTLQTFIPQIQPVTCSVWGDDCEPSACFTRSIRTP